MDPKNIWAERVLWRFPSEILIFPKAQNTCLLGVACIFFFLFETIKIRVALMLGPRCPGLFCQVILQVRLMMILFTMISPVKTFPLVLISAEGRQGRQKPHNMYAHYKMANNTHMTAHAARPPP